MEAPQKISKQLAAVLNNAYSRAIEAREAVEHRLSSMPKQEAVVRLWQENLSSMAATNYPGHDLSSYPVQTRVQREIEKLKRYRKELPERLERYATALAAIESMIQEVLVAISCGSSTGPTVSWPVFPSLLRDDPWPGHWPPLLIQSECRAPEEAAYSFNTNRSPQPRRSRTPTSFTLAIADQLINLHALYEDGIEPFISALDEFLHGTSSSRWPAITEAIRCDIRWPQLDRYLAECNEPWLPDELVSAEYGLRGTLNRRDELADLMAEVTPDAGRWYLSRQPSRSRLDAEVDLRLELIEELMAVGLVCWGPKMSPAEMLRELPFADVKSAFTLAGLRPPKGFDAAVARYDELASARGDESIRKWIRKFVDPSSVIEIYEPDGWHREERLGPRARSNVLVSTLVLLHEKAQGPLRVINWGQLID